MNPKLQYYARTYIKEGLSKLDEKCIIIFKRMYSHEFIKTPEGGSYPKNGSVADLNKDIDKVVDDMPEDRLDCAMGQVEATLKQLQQKVVLSLNERL